MKSFAIFLVLAGFGVAPAAAADPLSSLHFLVGTWSCTYNAGKTHVAYTAKFAYDLNGNWIREHDSWKGGGGDEGSFTYDPKRGWTAVVLEQERGTVIFHATGRESNHIDYRSVYPDDSMNDLFEQSSPTRYTLHFTQNANGTKISSMDTCVKK